MIEPNGEPIEFDLLREMFKDTFARIKRLWMPKPWKVLEDGFIHVTIKQLPEVMDETPIFMQTVREHNGRLWRRSDEGRRELADMRLRASVSFAAQIKHTDSPLVFVRAGREIR